MSLVTSEAQYGCTPNDVKALVETQLRLLWSSPDNAKDIAPLMLWGAPGVGKSTLIRELCEAQGIGFIDIRLAQREPIDLRGLPVPKDDHVDWLLAGEWPRDPNSKGVILFDELSAADRTLQAAAYEIILDRRLGDLYQLPPGWLVIGAGNRLTDRAVAYSFSSALANRFCHLELQPDVQQWCGWAQQQGYPSSVVGFLKFAPQHFFNMEGNTERGWPSPRSWERVAKLLKQREQLQLSDKQLRIMISGLIGEGAAVPFFGFLEVQAELPDVHAMLAGSIQVSIPERTDALYAFCAAVAFHVRRNMKLLDTFFEIGSKLSSDFATLLMLDVLRNDKGLDEKRAEQVFSHSRYEQWTAQHGQQFAQALEFEGSL